MSIVRNPRLADEAKRQQPYCSRCFAEKKLEAHHLHALADGGPDEIENMAVLCRVCHREWHRSFDGMTDHETFLDTPTATMLACIARHPVMSQMTSVEIRQHWLAFQMAETLKRVKLSPDVILNRLEQPR